MTASHALDRDELLTELRRLADELGSPPTYSEMNEHGQYSVAPYYRVFESWPAALQAAGLKSNTSRAERSDAELLAEIQRLADGDDPPSKAEMATAGAYAAGTYRVHFGSWTAALREAGFTPPTSGTRIPDAELCEALVDLAAELDSTPTSADMTEHGPYSAGTYVNRFGSWQDALAAAGLDPDDTQGPATTAELTDALREFAADRDRPPLAREMTESGPYHASTYYRRFGSWDAALEAAGIEPRDEPPEPANRIAREELLAELRRLAAHHDGDEPPTTTLMDAEGKYSAGTYLNRFESWAAALEAAGLIPSQG